MIDETMLQGIGMTSRRTRTRLVERLRREGISNEKVLEVILRTPRHIFVDEALSSRAYDDTALPIGYGQTISQPYIVARMTEALLEGGTPLGRVLEIGTGSGYQAAVLAQLVSEVYTVERIRALYQLAQKRFRALKLYNVRSRFSDGGLGLPEAAPFDAILLTAAPPDVPRTLLGQLAVGGRLLAPVGREGAQELVLYERAQDGITARELSAVSFVPMLGGTA